VPLYKKNNESLLHIHVPKTGGTSVMSALKEHNVETSFIQKASNDKYGGVPPQHMDIGYTKMFFDLSQVETFAVVRDPWHRTVSEYVWRTRSINFTKINQWLADALTNLQHQDYQNHLLPQCKFINEDVTVFSYNDWNKMCHYVGNRLKIKDFKVKHWRQKRFDYKVPQMDLLDKDVQIKWQQMYNDDVELYHSL